MPIDLRLDPAEVALLTDLYELTVGAAFFEHGFNDTASFEVSMRRMPSGRGFMVAAGIERLIEALEEYRFDAAAIEHLETLQLFKPAFSSSCRRSASPVRSARFPKARFISPVSRSPRFGRR